MDNLHDLPQQFTSFVGREQELSEVASLLAAPDCRLLTMTGPGGIGKTRLAMAAVAGLGTTFTDGIYFISLQSVDDSDILIPTIADHLDFSLAGQDEPMAQLCEYLDHKRILLVLDNFEQLLDAAESLTSLLRQSAVHLLVTSREALQVQGEWIYAVTGLALSVNSDEADRRGAAVQLFVERARRVDPRFTLAEEGDAVEVICRLVEGMPLAIELAAAWIRSLSCPEIAIEIERNLVILSTHLRDLPHRHRSIQAIFTQTWQLLSVEEQSVFRQLAVLGGFRRDAAMSVAGASLPLLSSLIDRSLLRWEREAEASTSHGRYQIHELLRQYAAGILHREPDQERETLDQHGRYYSRFLVLWHDDLVQGGRQDTAMAEINAELDNVRTAWRWAIDRAEPADLEPLATVLMNFLWYRSRYREARDSFQDAILHVQKRPISSQRDHSLAVIYNYLAWHLMVLGEMEASDEAAQQSNDLYERLGVPPIEGIDTDPRFALGTNARLRGEYSEARILAKAALADSIDRPHLQKQHFAHRTLCEISLDMGDLVQAEAHARQAFHLLPQDDQWSASYVHELIASVATERGEYETAERHFKISYDIRHALHHRVGMADSLQKLGLLALRQGKYDRAEDFLEQSLTIFRKNHVAPGEIETLSGLAGAALAQKDVIRAHDYLRQASRHVVRPNLQYTPQVLLFLTRSAEYLHVQGELALAVQLLTALSQHVSRRVDVNTIESLLTLCRIELDVDTFTAAAADGKERTTAEFLVRLQTILRAPPTSIRSKDPAVSSAEHQPLFEPLTARELQVLHLVALGLTNQQIADELIIAIGTVKSYTSQIYGKLGVSHRTQAVAESRKLGLLP